MHDAIVVGSGPAGTFVAYGLQGRDVLVLDVGRLPPPACGLAGNLYDLRRSSPDLFAQLIGQDFAGLRNLAGSKVSLKLKAPCTEYVIRGWERLFPVRASGFEPMQSFARGGLANAWGAGVFRFNDRDLRDFPLAAADLDPFYDEITAHIGVSGASDDLDPWFGPGQGLMAPLALSCLGRELLAGYQRRRELFRSRGIAVGHPRLAVLTREHRGRAPYAYDAMEFFKPRNPAIYNPAFTLEELMAAGAVRYLGGRQALAFRETPDGVEVTARNLETGDTETHAARSLFLAAGALGSARLALASAGDHSTRLPILDNPMSCIPLFRPGLVGRALDPREPTLGQLCVVFDPGGGADLVQGTIYGTNGPLRTDAIFEFPLPIRASLAWAKHLSPAMGLLMLFHPGVRDAENHVRLAPDGALDIRCRPVRPGGAEGPLIRAFCRIGFFSHPALCVRPGLGQGLHYAGLLPMAEHPGPYQTDADGLLHGAQRVYVTDGACFPALPAKNLTFTIMANALRIARKARETL